jgi:hypothetical protein
MEDGMGWVRDALIMITGLDWMIFTILGVVF